MFPIPLTLRVLHVTFQPGVSGPTAARTIDVRMGINEAALSHTGRGSPPTPEVPDGPVNLCPSVS